VDKVMHNKIASLNRFPLFKMKLITGYPLLLWITIKHFKIVSEIMFTIKRKLQTTKAQLETKIFFRQRKILLIHKKTPFLVLNVKTELISVKEAKANPIEVAAANWVATGWMVSQLINNLIVVDVGSTTTSIIPVVDGKIATEGKTDLEKLQNGELVYSGSLRTNVATIVNVIPVRKTDTRVCSELFAQSGDVHFILGNIGKKDCTSETSDGRGKTRKETIARLARVVSADTDMLTEQDIVALAQFVYEKQVAQIAEGLKQVYERIKLPKEKTKIIVTGLGRNFLARKAAEKVGFNQIIDMKDILDADSAVVSSSVGVALMVANRLEGKTVEWMQF